jgi:hypothetical protein
MELQTSSFAEKNRPSSGVQINPQALLLSLLCGVWVACSIFDPKLESEAPSPY